MNNSLKILPALIAIIFPILLYGPAPTMAATGAHNGAPADIALIEEQGLAIGNSHSPATGFIADISWESIEDAPSAFGRSVGGVIGDYYYVFGGQFVTDMALAYNLVTSTWQNSTPPIEGSFNSGFCIAAGSLYKLCGSDAVNDFERFDPAGDGYGTWSSLALPSSEFRTTTNGCAWDGGNYIYANNCDYSNPPEAHFARYNIAENSWETLMPPPGPRRYAGLASVQGNIYLIGGLGLDDRDYHRCQMYLPDIDDWQDIAPHPDSLNFTSTIVISDGSFIWTVGHGGGFGDYPISPHVHYYDPATDTWNQEIDLPTVRGLALAGYDQTRNRLMRGGGNFGGGTIYYADCYIGAGLPTAIDSQNDKRPLPDSFSFSSYPNPFNPDIRFEFELSIPALVDLQIYNLSGQRVAVLAAGDYAAGHHSLTWNTTSTKNIKVSAGIYFARLQVDRNCRVKKIVLIK